MAECWGKELRGSPCKAAADGTVGKVPPGKRFIGHFCQKCRQSLVIDNFGRLFAVPPKRVVEFRTQGGSGLWKKAYGSECALLALSDTYPAILVVRPGSTPPAGLDPLPSEWFESDGLHLTQLGGDPSRDRFKPSKCDSWTPLPRDVSGASKKRKAAASDEAMCAQVEVSSEVIYTTEILGDAGRSILEIAQAKIAELQSAFENDVSDEPERTKLQEKLQSWKSFLDKNRDFLSNDEFRGGLGDSHLTAEAAMDAALEFLEAQAFDADDEELADRCEELRAMATAEIAHEIAQPAASSSTPLGAAAGASSSAATPPRFLAVGCANGLAAVSSELDAIAAALPTCSVLRDASAEEVAREAPRFPWFHFAGHADPRLGPHRTLVWRKNGRADAVDASTLVQMLRGAELVVLNGCKSLELAEALARAGVPNVVGCETLLLDRPGSLFAEAFWRMVAAESVAGQPLPLTTVRRAFEAGEVAVGSATGAGGTLGTDGGSVPSSTPLYALGIDPEDGGKVVQSGQGRGRCLPAAGAEAVGRLAAGRWILLQPLPPSKLLSNLGPFPSLPSHYVPREVEERLCTALLARAAPMAMLALSGARAATSSVAGVAGLGKTTIMTWLGRSVRVQTVFSDGICWLAFGQERDAFGRMRELAEMLGMPRDEIKELRDVTDAARQLQPRLKGKRMLLMLDDVWRLEQAKPFKGLASEGVSVLLTTRKGEIVDFCGEQLLPLGPMADAVALRVLVESSGKTEAALRGAEPEALVALLKKCSGLPAMLRMVGQRCSCGEVGAVLHFLETHKLEHEVPTSLEAAEGYGNLFVMLEGQLDDIEQHQDEQLARQCTMLAALPEDTPVPLDVLQLLWGLGKAGTQQRVDLLAKRHLVEPSADGKGIAPLLDVVRDYLACRAKSELKGWHAALVQRWMEGCGEVLTMQEGEYWWKSLNHHIAGAGEAVTIPDSVTSIGDHAFYYCSGLASVTIPDSVTSIGNWAFSYCGLASVTIPDSVTSIGGFAFESCICLTSVTIPDSVTSIGEQAFIFCSFLTSINIPASVTSIGNWAFGSCTVLTSVTIAALVTGDRAFDGCTGLTSVTMPASVTSIGDRAFSSCSGLTSVTIPASVTSIGSDAFSSCTGLTSVTIPASVTSIGGSAFLGCTGLTSFTIPASVTSIGDHAFFDCSGLTSVTIPDSVTSIGVSAFCGCTGLTSVTIPASVTSIGNWAFRGCSGLTSATIPASVASIGDSAFYRCSGLTSVTIPASVISIGDYAFLGCSGLTSVTIPASVTSIGVSAFCGCTGLTSVTIPDSVTSIGKCAFCDCTGLTSVTIPDSVTSIGVAAFRDCSGLTSVTIPASVTSIGKCAFFCTGLTSVTIPDSVTSIGVNAFQSCRGLTVTVASVTLDLIGIDAFSGCTVLTPATEVP